MRCKKTVLGVLATLVLTLIMVSGIVSASAESKQMLPVAQTKKAVSTEILKDAKYTGSKACKDCHQKEFTGWADTWHANMYRDISPSIVKADFNNIEITYKDLEIEGQDKKKAIISPSVRLNKEGDKFTLTLIDKDNPLNNQTYSIAYVYGGNWEQHFLAKVGDMLFPTPMRWVMADGQWRTKPFNDFWWIADGTPDGRPENPERMPLNQVSDAKCNACHATGFKTAKDKITSKWSAQKTDLGISCEACHGPGSKHVQTKTKDTIINPVNLNALQQDQLCGQCHSRVTNKNERDLDFPQDFFPGNTDLQDRVEFWTYSTKPKNFWPNDFASKNRQQYHDTQKHKHQNAGVTCITCHNEHSSEKGNSQLRTAKTDLCTQCHSVSKEIYTGSRMATAGVNCTDCHMAKIASRAGATTKTKEFWDASSHTFKAVMPYTADDYKMRSSCDSCHSGEVRNNRGNLTLERQMEVKKKIDNVTNAISIYEQKGKKALKSRELLNTVLLDKSFGAHNYQKAITILDDAMKSLKK